MDRLKCTGKQEKCYRGLSKFVKNMGRLKCTGKQEKCYRGLSKEKWSMFAICALTDDIGLKCCLDVHWKSEVGAFTMKNVHQLKNDSDVFNILESISTNQNVHIYLADKADREELSEELFEDCFEAIEEVGEGVSDALEKDANVEEPETVAEDANFEESRKDAKEHDETCNVEEEYETIVEDANVEEPENVVENANVKESEKDANEHDATCNVDEADKTIVKDANKHYAHNATLENSMEEDAVEVDACSNEVGGGNTFAGDAEPETVEEGESEINEEEEDVDSGFFDSDSDVGEDEVAQADVSHRVVQNLEGLYGDRGKYANENEDDGEGYIKTTSRSKVAFKTTPRSKTTFKAKVVNKKQAKINPPTTSKPTFYRGEPSPPSQHSIGQRQPPSVMIVRWLMSTQEGFVSNPPAKASNAHD
ncbi:hypothetical protein V6N12_044352 [Hibiscus sabdariffa]|uniref:PB1-like domain-containing protein n=2 Tax=Hibiscus sabdariffa TaxID=183260 RepID=A0ABR2DH17_9ROSI